MMDFDTVRRAAPDVAEAMERELVRQRDSIELIASENFVSPAVMAAVGSHLTNKYAEGYPNKRYYGGCANVDIIEDIARQKACELFGAEHANVQPHSGSNANMAAYFALLDYGDRILGMDLSHGGHLTHGSPVNFSGKQFEFISYGLNADTETIDYDEVRKKALECRPRLIVAGASAYPREIDFAKFRRIADEAGALLMVDMAHIVGLVATGQHMSPIPYADVVTATTHKTLRGPRGGMILCKQQYAAAIDKAVFPGIQGGPLMHVIAGKAICFEEALKPGFREYQKRIKANAKALEKSLTAEGIRLVSGGTDNHLLLADLGPDGISGREAEELLDRANITVNKNSVPNDTRSLFVTSGLRMGTPAATTRGLTEEDFDIVGRLIARVIHEKEAALGDVREAVAEMTAKYPLY